MTTCGVGRRSIWAIGLCLPGCGGAQDIRAVIQDAAGRPIPGAILYAESYVHAGAFDFAWGTAGDAGEVPATGNEALTIGWRRGAKLALAAFAPGKKPFVVYDPLGRVKANGLVIQLQDWPEQGARWEPRLAHLSYPFATASALARRAATPQCAALRRAFRTAYAPLTDPRANALPRELTKLRALEGLERTRPSGP